MSNEYAQKVEILLRMIPIVTEESVFAVHGGSQSICSYGIYRAIRLISTSLIFRWKIGA